MVELLHGHHLLLREHSQLPPALLLLLLHLADLKEEYLADAVGGLVGDGAEEGQEVLFVFKGVPGVGLLLEEGEVVELEDIGDEGVGGGVVGALLFHSPTK